MFGDAFDAFDAFFFDAPLSFGSFVNTMRWGEMASWQMRGVTFPAEPPTFI